MASNVAESPGQRLYGNRVAPALPALPPILQCFLPSFDELLPRVGGAFSFNSAVTTPPLPFPVSPDGVLDYIILGLGHIMAAHRLEGLPFFTRAPRTSPYQAHAYAPLASAITRHVLPRSLLDSHAIADNRKSRASRACGADRRLLFRTDCRPPIYPHLLGLA
ncbi:hypothetical protein CMUS01_07398 [Colletotrichum musicola]|uniref:Uncharacterized protein n=1 Tax=Colletotrichum musicola TaxID=2175873 RepID=A0A8H6KHA6_9PEZI|nr:hypothetical protein CMUS01_07398 [Colletotrichum musicola]